jgi:hydroxymethylpyrimidine/phosphomethylpyrimidine kinase
LAGKCGRVLLVAASDSGGGAGIEGDIKTVTALGGYATTAITALTAQDSKGIHGIHDISPQFVARQMRAVLGDIGADAIKTGMLGRAGVVSAVCEVIEEQGRGVPLVVDPVMVSTSGVALLDEVGIDCLKARLLPMASLVTPNIPEAERLSGRNIGNLEDMGAAAADILATGVGAVLIKGGHLPGEVVRDLLVWPGGEKIFEQPRIDTDNTHGTGCALASAVATGLAQRLELADAVARARAYLQGAIAQAKGFGEGHGPLAHGFAIPPFKI